MTELSNLNAKFDEIAESKLPATIGYVAQVAKALMKGIREPIAEKFQSTDSRTKELVGESQDQLLVLIEGLERRCAELEARDRKSNVLRRIEELERQPMQYLGIHQSGKEYRKNQFVTLGGSVWACTAATTTQRPGDSDAGHWTLACKRGRDGKP